MESWIRLEAFIFKTYSSIPRKVAGKSFLRAMPFSDRLKANRALKFHLAAPQKRIGNPRTGKLNYLEQKRKLKVPPRAWIRFAPRAHGERVAAAFFDDEKPQTIQFHRDSSVFGDRRESSPTRLENFHSRLWVLCSPASLANTKSCLERSSSISRNFQPAHPVAVFCPLRSKIFPGSPATCVETCDQMNFPKREFSRLRILVNISIAC